MGEMIRYDEIVQDTAASKATMMEVFDANVNRNAKDSIFCDLFGRPEYCLQLYQVLHPEDKDVKAENIVLEIDLNETIAAKVLELAKTYGKKVYAIVGNMSVILAHPEFLRQTDCFICNEIEAGRLFDSAAVPAFSPEQMLEYLPVAAKAAGIPSMVVTMGSRGSVYYEGRTGAAGICPPYPAAVVDTCGAGDAFFSGTVMGLTRRLPLEEAVRYGAKLASLTIESQENSCPALPDFFSEQVAMMI